MPSLSFNAITGKFDMIGMTSAEVASYLKLDQTTPQNVINGSPQFDAGIKIKENQWIYLDGA